MWSVFWNTFCFMSGIGVGIFIRSVYAFLKDINPVPHPECYPHGIYWNDCPDCLH